MAATLRNCPKWSDSIRFPLLGTLIVSGMAMAAGAASAQDATTPRIGGEVVVPIEIEIRTVNAEVQCLPQRVPLPPGDMFVLNLVNNAELPVMFVAPEFFEAAEIVDATDVVFSTALGGFLVPSETTQEVVFRTPPPGEYGYACFKQFEQPTPESTGFMIVVPPPG